MKYVMPAIAFLTITLLPWALPAVLHGAEKMPDSFVHLEEIIPDAVLDIRYFGKHNFLGVRVDGYLAPTCILTRDAARALAKVQKDLTPFSMTLKIYDCYRPQQAVDHFVRWAKDIGDIKTKKEFYPTVDKKNLFRDGYVADRSSHSRGSTVDLTIVPLPAPFNLFILKERPLRNVICRRACAMQTILWTWERGLTASMNCLTRTTKTSARSKEATACF